MKKWLEKLFRRPGAEIAAPVEAAEPEPTPSSSPPIPTQVGTGGETQIGESKLAENCPYCGSREFVKRGKRKKKLEEVQLYLCRNPECGKTFTAQFVKGKHFPLNVIIEAMSYYNLGLTLEDTCRIIREKFNLSLNPSPDLGREEAKNNPLPRRGERRREVDGMILTPETVASWIQEYKHLCRYERLRPFALKMYAPKDTVEVVTMAHRQLFRFRYHRAKTALMLQEFPNRRFRPLKEYLDNVSSETPHQYFQEGFRMSEVKTKFDKADMIVKGKYNFANRLAEFALSAVKENKNRHEALQRFMLANDSVTVATEVPVYIRAEDIEHLQNQLGFEVVGREGIKVKNRKRPGADFASRLKASGLPRLLTGHIDLVQIRNGQIHLLDYKPGAAKEKPIEQLTWYALALSRLTGLRLFEFKCAWFDEKDFFEFYPLHVVKKIRAKKKRRVRYKEGTVAEIPQKNILTVIPGKYKKYEKALKELT